MNCENCKYYIRHYAVHKYLGIIRTDCGHCVHKLIKKRNLKDCADFEEGNFDDVENEKTLSILNGVERVRRACDRIFKELQELTDKIKE